MVQGYKLVGVGTIFRYAIIGFALTEAVGLLALMMAFLILFI